MTIHSFTTTLRAGITSRFLSVTLVLLPALLLAIGSSIAAGATQDHAVPTGRLIVKYHAPDVPGNIKGGDKLFRRSHWRQERKLAFKRALSDYQELVSMDQDTISNESLFNDPSDAMALLNKQVHDLAQDAEIDYVSIEYRRYPLLQPNDPLYEGDLPPGNQSYLYNGAFSLQAPGAWDITTGSSDSVIAIVDTGVLPNHPEIANRSIPGLGYDFVSADSPRNFTSANDGDGRDDNPFDPGDPFNGSPSSWHGTSVASAAAGNSNDAEGITGIDWNARLLHARALGLGGGTDADIIDAVRWSAGLSVTGVPDNPTPANVVNLSLGGATECTRAWQDVIDELAQINVAVVLAAGNESSNALRSSPANCANIISVSSSTAAGSVNNGFSNFGIKVAITTHGQNIVVASNSGLDEYDPNGNNYRLETGTSFSAALVSGAISLLHSINPDLSPTQVRAVLQQSATPYASGNTCDFVYCGGGILNLAGATAMLQNGNFDPQSDPAKSLVTNQSVPLPLEENTDASLFGFRDTRYFSIDVPQNGLLQVESTGDSDIFAYLLDPQLSVIALDDDSGEFLNFRVASLVQTGTYTIAVERAIHSPIDGETPFTLTAALSNDTPQPFTFSPQNSAAASSLVLSDTITIRDLIGDSILTVSNGFYSLNGGDLMTAATTVSNGDSVQLAVQSSGQPNDTALASVSVGAYSTDFIVTTEDNRNSVVASVDTDSGSSSTDSSSGSSTGDLSNGLFGGSSGGGAMSPVETMLFLALLLTGTRTRRLVC